MTRVTIDMSGRVALVTGGGYGALLAADGDQAWRYGQAAADATGHSDFNGSLAG